MIGFSPILISNRDGRQFGNSSAQVDIPSLDPDTLGVYAGTFGGQNATLVVVNKDPNNTVSLNLTGIAEGQYYMRHFGGQAGAAKFEVRLLSSSKRNSVLNADASDYSVLELYKLHRCSLVHSRFPPRTCSLRSALWSMWRIWMDGTDLLSTKVSMYTTGEQSL